MRNFLQFSFRCAKQFFLATFYGFRQWGFQLLCWIMIQRIIDFAEIDHSVTYRWIVEGALYGSILFTMLYHWMGIFIPKGKPFVRFMVPYSFCAAMLLCWWFFVERKELLVCLLSGVASPFICQLFFFLEDYLKKVLTPHRKTFKGIKVVCNTVTLLPFLAVVVFVVVFAMSEVGRRHRFDDSKTLSRITEVEFPKFKVIDYDGGLSSFHGDYQDVLILEFKEMPSEEFYASIEALTSGADWHMKGDSVYCYSRIWGNGMPAPKGENSEEDVFLKIEIKRGEKRFQMSYGVW